MGDLRLIDEPGLHGVAGLLDAAAADVFAAGRGAIAAVSAVSGPEGTLRSVFLVAEALEATARDLRLRQIVRPVSGPSCALLPVTIDPSPVSLTGVDESSESWERGTVREPDRDWIEATLTRGDWGGQTAARQADYRGPLGTFSASALAAEGQAQGWVGFDDWGIELGGVAEVGVFLAQVEYGVDTRFLDVDSEAFVGAEASVAGDLDFNIFDGGVGLEGGIDAFFGMAAAAETKVGSEAARVVAGGEVGIGFGVDADVSGTFDDGVLRFEFGASGFIGVGGGFDLGLEVDLGAIGSATLDVLSWAADGIASLWR